MAVVRFEPFRDLVALQSDLARFADGLFGAEPQAGSESGGWAPPLDVVETEDDVILAFDLPGVSAADIAVEIDGGRLTISGERVREYRAEEDRFRRFERRFGPFSRSVTLPQGTEEASIEADHTDGVLEIRIPKPEESKPRRVEVGSPKIIEHAGAV